MRFIAAPALILSLLLIPCAAPSASPAAEKKALDVGWTITLDYTLLARLMEKSFGVEEGGRAVAAKGQCTLITVGEPRLEPDGDLLRTTMSIDVDAGVPLLGDCIRPVRFKGLVRLWQEPWLDPKTWRLKLRTVRSELLNDQGEQTVAADVVMSLVREHVHGFVDQFGVDLSGPHAELRGQLPLFFPPAMAPAVERWLGTIYCRGVGATPQGLAVALAMTVDAPAAQPPRQKPPKPTAAQVDAFCRYWQVWDSYVVAEIMALGGDNLGHAERAEILATLLDMRYAFVAALRADNLDRALVRHQFARTWAVLAPIVRRHAWQNGLKLFNYLALMNASDALAALDALGPAIGLEITEEGLWRLASLVSQDPRWAAEDPGEAHRQKLRRILRLAPVPPSEDHGGLWDWLVPKAWAEEPWAPPDQEALEQWRPPLVGENAGPYIRRVRTMLDEVSDKVERDEDLSKRHHGLLARIIETTAWQESCWRQFVPGEGGGLTYLRSYNNTSVGLMQIHTYVWRGLYDPQKLRWSIRYNAWAGCEILALYLRRYALDRLAPGQTMDDDMLARVVYAMYNGGPGQFWAFQKRWDQGRLLLSDKLFWQKYSHVKTADYSQIARCLVGG